MSDNQIIVLHDAYIFLYLHTKLLKVITKRGPSIFLLQRIPDFAFDVEVLFLAQLMKLPLVEVPIDWYYRTESKVHPLWDGLAITRDILRTQWEARRRKYGTIESADRDF